MPVIDPEFPNITSTAGILGGKPCIKGTRISVEFILEMVAAGATVDSLVYEYPELSGEEVRQALRYAARCFRNTGLMSVPVEA